MFGFFVRNFQNPKRPKRYVWVIFLEGFSVLVVFCSRICGLKNLAVPVNTFLFCFVRSSKVKSVFLLLFYEARGHEVD